MSVESIQNIGFVGLGRMGAAIANNILKSGFHLVVYNRTPQKTRALVEAGAESASSPKEAAARSDVLLTSLTDDNALLDVVTSEEGILSGFTSNKIHVGTSTISPSLSTKLAKIHDEQGSLYLSAPVLGNPTAAQAAKLTTFVAGDQKSIELCSKLFNSYCQKIINTGSDQAKSNILKLSANYIMSVILDAIGQVYSLGEKSNVDLQLMNELLEMIFDYPGLKQYANRIRKKDFDNVGFDLSSAFKDIQLILQASKNIHVPLPFAGEMSDKFTAAIANDLGKKDWISTYKITRILAGLKN
jgi:3-hydroxyisobutyrate dehydrogenase-like beta-hydroxyacid dehydrogenase